MKAAGRTETMVLVGAMRLLSRTIISDDGVANAAIGEAAARLHEQAVAISGLRHELGGLIDLLERLRTEGDSKYSYVESRSGALIDVALAIDSARSLLERIKW